LAGAPPLQKLKHTKNDSKIKKELSIDLAEPLIVIHNWLACRRTKSSSKLSGATMMAAVLCFITIIDRARERDDVAKHQGEY
jgi:hypothetical protein